MFSALDDKEKGIIIGAMEERDYKYNTQKIFNLIELDNG